MEDCVSETSKLSLCAHLPMPISSGLQRRNHDHDKYDNQKVYVWRKFSCSPEYSTNTNSSNYHITHPIRRKCNWPFISTLTGTTT